MNLDTKLDLMRRINLRYTAKCNEIERRDELFGRQNFRHITRNLLNPLEMIYGLIMHKDQESRENEYLKWINPYLRSAKALMRYLNLFDSFPEFRMAEITHNPFILEMQDASDPVEYVNEARKRLRNI